MDLNSFLTDVPVDTGLGATNPTLTTPMAQAQARQAPAVKTPFGIGGGLGDVLGHVMDMFLVEGGLKPVYQERKQNARDIEMLGGADNIKNNPLAAGLAMMQANPGRGAKFLEDLSQIEARNATTQKTQIENDASVALAPIELGIKKLKIGDYLFALGSTANKNNAKQVYQRILQQSKLYNVEGDFGLPKDESPEAIRDWAGAGVTASTRYLADRTDSRFARTAAQGDERIDISRESAGVTAEGVASASKDRQERIALAREEAKERARHNKAMEDKPTGKGRGDRVAPPPPPRKVGDSITSLAGVKMVSKNGKTWVKP